MRALFVFCEGPHDTHFLSRVLRAMCAYEVHQGKIGDFPDPLRTFLEKRFEADQARHGAWSLKKLQQGVMPRLELALTSADRTILVLFFVCGGVANAADVVPFLKSLRAALTAPFGPPPTPGVVRQTIDTYATAFCYDADAAGVDARIGEFRTGYGSHFGDLTSLAEGAWLGVSGEHVACIVFRAHGKDQGTLEDIVTPMLRAKRSKELEAAEDFLAAHMWDGCLLKGTLKSDAQALETKRKKAALTALGQFDHPSASLAVFLEKTEIIDAGDLSSDPACQGLAALLSALGELHRAS